jgi:hypothetical protein
VIRKKQIAIILCMSACALLLLAAPVLAQAADSQGQQAGTQISSTIDGTSQPGSIYRAGLLGLVNRVFGYFNQAPPAGNIKPPAALPKIPKEKIKIPAPQITAATIEVDEAEHPINVKDGKKGTISLADHDPADVLAKGSITVNTDSTLTLRVPANRFLSYELPVSQSLKKGENELDVLGYLGAFYPDGGLTLAKIKDVFNGSRVIILNGTLANGSKNKENVSLKITLP